jgi:hypothetical protein
MKHTYEDYKEDLGVDGKVILKCILVKQIMLL